MQPLDLKEFVWENAEGEKYLILAITHYNDDNVVVYREAVDRSQICVMSVSDFCAKFDATYPLT